MEPKNTRQALEACREKLILAGIGRYEVDMANAALAASAPTDTLAAMQEALREACLHQGLPEDAPPERIAAHFRNNREYREGWDALASVREPAEQENER